MRIFQPGLLASSPFLSLGTGAYIHPILLSTLFHPFTSHIRATSCFFRNLLCHWFSLILAHVHFWSYLSSWLHTSTSASSSFFVTPHIHLSILIFLRHSTHPPQHPYLSSWLHTFTSASSSFFVTPHIHLSILIFLRDSTHPPQHPYLSSWLHTSTSASSSFFVTPHINCSILISFTSTVISRSFVVSRVPEPHANAGLCIPS